MAIKKTTYVIEVDTKTGKVKIDGLTKGFVDAEKAAKNLNKTLQDTSQQAGQVASKTGLAGAAVVEIGRAISDSNFGMMAMANNLQQISTLMITLIATSGGLAGGLKALWSAFMGPLGLIVVFQAAIAWLEKLDMQARQTSRAANSVAEAYANAATELELLLELDADMTEEQRANVEERIRLIKEEAKVRAQIAEIQKLQTELIRLENQEARDLVSWYEKIWIDIKSGNFGKRLPGTMGETESVTSQILGLGEAEREEQRKEIEGKIADIIASIDPDAISRITAEKQKKGRKGPKQKKLFLELFGLAGLDTASPEELNAAMTAMVVEMQAREAMRQEDLANQEAYTDAMKELDMLLFEQKMMTMDAIGSGLNSLGQLLGRSTEEGKFIAAAGALIDTYAAIAAILKNTAKTPAGGIPGFAIAQAVAAGLFGMAQVKKIYSVKVPKARGGGGAAQNTSLPEPLNPSFNIVGSSGTNQLRDSIVGALNEQPIRTYVLPKDVRSGEEFDRNIIDGARIG